MTTNILALERVGDKDDLLNRASLVRVQLDREIIGLIGIENDQEREFFVSTNELNALEAGVRVILRAAISNDEQKQAVSRLIWEEFKRFRDRPRKQFQNIPKTTILPYGP